MIKAGLTKRRRHRKVACLLHGAAHEEAQHFFSLRWRKTRQSAGRSTIYGSSLWTIRKRT